MTITMCPNKTKLYNINIFFKHPFKQNPKLMSIFAYISILYVYSYERS